MMELARVITDKNDIFRDLIDITITNINQVLLTRS